MTGGCIQAHAEPTPRGVTRPVKQQPSRAVRVLAGGLVMALLLLTGACTGDGEEPEDSAASPLPSRSVGSSPTFEAKPVPIQVEVARVVGGRLKPKQRRTLTRQVGAVVSRYFDAAFLAGDYPRRDFADALGTFSQGAARQARSDRALLTNAAVGPEVEAVVPRAKRVWLDVLVPRRFVVGLTARFRLVFVQEQLRGADQKVAVSGRLLMRRKKSGRLQIFGYDVSRSSVPASGKGEGR